MAIKKLGLFLIPAVFGVAAGVSAYSGFHNNKRMNRGVDDAVDILKHTFSITEEDAGEFGTIRMAKVLKFDVKKYKVKGLGNLCIMKVNMGLMHMSTLVLTAYEKNMPMMSVDYMYMPGKCKAYVEVYDLVEDKNDAEYQWILDNLKQVADGFTDLPDFEHKPAWNDSQRTVFVYKECKGSQVDRAHELYSRMIEAYAKTAKEAAFLDEDQMAGKLDVIQEYCDAMIEKGGAATDNFKKMKGEDFTREFFNKVMFAPADYKISE